MKEDKVFGLVEKWRKGIPGRGNRMDKCMEAGKIKPVRGMANSVVLEYKMQKGKVN